MAKYTLEQLRSKAWSSREQALKDLKSGGIKPRGDDYELGEHKPGSWQLLPFGDTAPAVREQVVIDNLRKKPGAKPRGAPDVIVEAKAPAKAKNGASVAIVATPAPVPDAPVAGKGKATPAVPASPAVVSPAPEPAIDPLTSLDALPSGEGPFEIVLTDASFPKAGVVAFAFDLSRKLKTIVHVRDGQGVTRRSLNAATILAAKKSAARSTRAVTPRDPAKPSKFTRAADLLFRPKGATAAELSTATGWDVIGRRHVNRCAKLNNDATVEEIAKDHWRLIKA